jgi:CHAT domain-containing protein
VVVIDDRGRPTLLLAQDSAERLRDLPAALDRLVELSPLATAIENILTELGYHETVLVPTGLLGMLPLHALPTASGYCLDDVMGLRLAPSAAVYAASTRRACAQRTPRLLAVADTRALFAAQYEVRQLQATFGGAATILENATRDDVLAAARGCTHVHFACHGDSALGGTVASGLRLADARLTVDDLLDGRLTDCRLAVASACQSGHYPLTATTDDFTGLAAGFLQAGAAAAVVSLWQVADVATAVLMSYFYEQLDAYDPPAALRRARGWLRDLSREDADEYLRSRPALASLAERLPRSPRPYKSPVFWAAFHCYGR